MGSNFDNFCRAARVTADEREKLAWHLAQHRARRTYDALAIEPEADTDRRCFAPCFPGTFCKCLGYVIGEGLFDPFATPEQPEDRHG